MPVMRTNTDTRRYTKHMKRSLVASAGVKPGQYPLSDNVTLWVFKGDSKQIEVHVDGQHILMVEKRHDWPTWKFSEISSPEQVTCTNVAELSAALALVTYLVGNQQANEVANA